MLCRLRCRRARCRAAIRRRACRHHSSRLRRTAGQPRWCAVQRGAGSACSAALQPQLRLAVAPCASSSTTSTSASGSSLAPAGQAQQLKGAAGRQQLVAGQAHVAGAVQVEQQGGHPAGQAQRWCGHAASQ
jgi:hypothetical protein